MARYQSLGEVGAGPLFAAPGPRGPRVIRRIRGIVLEIVGFVVVTALLPLLLVAALLVDLYLRIARGKPMVGVRLVAFGWWFLLTEMWTLVCLLAIWVGTGGPFGAGSMRRRRGIYWLRPRWLGALLGGFKALFGLRFEVDGREAASPGRALIMIRHASIIDNTLADTQLAGPLGMGIRYVVKRELELLPLIDIGGRWITTNFVQRESGDATTEIAKLRQLAHRVGPAEAVLIYPEGTRATASKIARAKEIIRERGDPVVAPLAETMVNLLPPRLGGPLALLEEAPDFDVVFFAHVGFDGYEHIRDIWSGALVGATVRMKLWRVSASEIPRQGGEEELTRWLYGQWQEVDRWVGEQVAELGHTSSSGKVAAELRSPA
jgi:1-acyl-sn-glycerol-3-phosphate acyltransferase